jgi:hypothetical protein
LAEVVTTGLLRPSSPVEVVPGKIWELEEGKGGGDERKPRAFKGDDTAGGFGDIEL